MVNQPGNVWFPGFLDGAVSGLDFQIDLNTEHSTRFEHIL